MKQIVEFELLSDVMCGGVRIADNFLESEPFIRGSVLRAAFAAEILLECPLGDIPSRDGRYNFIEIKDADGKCKTCPRRAICEKFSDMTFSCAYKNGAFPAPFTSKVCKKCGTAHRIKDTISENGVVECDECTGKIRRMESLKGYIHLDGDKRVKKEKAEMSVSTHTAINYFTDTAKDGSLFTVKAIRRGQHFISEIDDCGSGMIHNGAVIYAGKYSSCGFGKMKIVSVTPAEEITEKEIEARIRSFNDKFGTENKAAILFMSDACLDNENNAPVSDDEQYREMWEKVLFPHIDLPFAIDTVFAETQLYSGYDTSKKWSSWKSVKPDLLILKGTSILLTIKDGRYDEAVKMLHELQKNGIGNKCADGYGQIEVCHKIHCVGVK